MAFLDKFFDVYDKHVREDRKVEKNDTSADELFDVEETQDENVEEKDPIPLVLSDKDKEDIANLILSKLKEKGGDE